MSLGLRVRQRPVSFSPSAANSWSPSACSSSSFFGAVTAKITGEPVVWTISRMPMVLPEPGSATMTCQLRLCRAERSSAWKRRSKAVSTKTSERKRGWVMRAAPLVTCEYAMGGLDDLGRHLGWQVEVLAWPVFWLRHSLIAQALRLDECLPVGDPIDGFARLDGSLRCGVCAQTPLLPECERGPLALVRVRLSPRSRRVCAWLWLPIH